ncbi:hypothetical protein TL16_g08862 [Triparma laevis f. inornata]|uniref:Protein kinase domain-containing protein n=1 Tax=Triparma laevis f. inornata TaxID=1714386 RepID=A0A9W7B010_9STRA|nr:hypothetical protein TL16_g08862 [Triparma laevis f. inornata]
MTSKLKNTNYHRAGSLGDGAFGAVVVVYSDTGTEFAQKTFSEDSDDEDYTGSLDVGVFRELSVLRLLMNRHENVLTIEDIVYDEVRRIGLERSEEDDEQMTTKTF